MKTAARMSGMKRSAHCLIISSDNLMCNCFKQNIFSIRYLLMKTLFM